ncbi:MAG: hypothetical protein R2764_06145 [Bacteroidales bacterium]
MASEYFFDVDPASEMGQALAITSGQNASENYVIDITGLTDGFHELFFKGARQQMEYGV